MCKIFTVTDASHLNVNSKFINSVRDAVCALSDKDGFGYSVLGSDGTISGERTIKPFNWKPLQFTSQDTRTDKLPIIEKTRNCFGEVKQKGNKSFMAHGRLSTNNVNIENTHPFMNNKVSLIHNGVVSDFTNEVKSKLTTTCDTEILLRYWEKGGMEAIEDNVTGYYAMIIQDKRGTTHVIRDSRASLYIAWCRTIKSYVIATTTDIIERVAKDMKWKVEHPELILDNTHAVFEGNNIVYQQEIQPLVVSTTTSLDSLAARAFGSRDVMDDYDRYSYESNEGYSDYMLAQYGKK